MTAQLSTRPHLPLRHLHPWWSEAALTWRRSFDGYRRVAVGLLAICTVATIIVLARNADAARWLHGQRMALAIGLGVVMLLALRVPMATLAQALRDGWMATLPLPAGSRRNMVLLATAGAGLLVWAWVAVAVSGSVVGTGLRGYLQLAGTVGAGVVLACGALAMLALRALRRPAVPLPRQGARIPLLSLSWLEDPQLPHLVAWQHRDCTRRWRTGGGVKPVGVLLLAFPGSSSPGPLVLLLVIVLLLSWYRCVLQASLSVVVAAAAPLRPLPLPPGLAARAFARFPASAGVSSVVLLFAALVSVQPPSWAALLSLLAVALAAPVTLARLITRLKELSR